MPTPSSSSAEQSAVQKVLVVGATGKLGGSIVRGLRARDIAVRAMVRSSEKAAELESLGCETVRADIRDRASLDAACRGVSHVVTTANAFMGRGAMDPKYVDLQGTRNLIDASVAQGVDRFIYISALIALPDSRVDMFRYKQEVERYLRASGLEHVIIRPTAFMEVWGDIVGGKIKSKGVATIFGDGNNPVNFIATDDVAAFAVRMVDDRAVVNESIAIGGPENLTLLEVASKFEKHAGVTAKRTHVPVPALRVLRVLLKPVNSVLSRMMSASLEMATSDMRFDDAELRARFPEHPMQSMDAWLSSR